MGGSTALLLAILLETVASASASQHSCADFRDLRAAEIELAGRLTFVTFPGPPNYRDVRRGDAREPTYILRLQAPICFSDGETRQTDRAHLYTTHDIWTRLRAARHRWVRIRGEGFAAHTGHHHAPLVVDVSEIVIERR